MARPPAHWRLWREHPAFVAGLGAELHCDGEVRRLYVRTQTTWRRGAAPSWLGVGWVCDGCGESVFEEGWRDALAERYADE